MRKVKNQNLLIHFLMTYSTFMTLLLLFNLDWSIYYIIGASVIFALLMTFTTKAFGNRDTMAE